MEFTLDCKTWRCGREHGENIQLGKGLTKLLNEEGYMCCVGQFMKQLGFTDDEIKHHGVAGGIDVKKDQNIFLHRATVENIEYDDCTIVATRLYGINDGLLPVREKIDKIRNILANSNHTLKVINESILPD